MQSHTPDALSVNPGFDWSLHFVGAAVGSFVGAGSGVEPVCVCARARGARRDHHDHHDHCHHHHHRRHHRHHCRHCHDIIVVVVIVGSDISSDIVDIITVLSAVIRPTDGWTGWW